MKSILTISTFIFFIATSIIAQAIPIGTYLDIEVKLNFGERKAMLDVDGTVYIIHSCDTILDDLRNLKKDHLKFLEAPDESWILSSNFAPSRVNDITFEISSEQSDYSVYDLLDTTKTHAFFDTAISIQRDSSYLKQRKFTNITSNGINDSTGNLISFSRKSIGSVWDKYLFRYIEDSQVIVTKCFRSGPVVKSDNKVLSIYSKETVRFTYISQRILNSKSIFTEKMRMAHNIL